MDKFGISDESTWLIRQALATFGEVERAVIFGSRAQGNHKEGSDIDLAIYGVHLSRETAPALSMLLNGTLSIPYFVDVLAPQYLEQPQLLEHIQGVGLPFYASEQGRGEGKSARALGT